ncbi:MAG: hypothetical protein ABJG15_08170 [Hyphomonadaceae bacterium]
MNIRELYDVANEGLNDVIFSGRYEGRPVYLSLDDYARKALGEKFDKNEGQVEHFIARIVGRQLSKKGDPYAPFIGIARRWNKYGRHDKPPFTAILFALSYAASLMASDENYSAGNYYERLSQIIDVPKDRLSANGKSTEIFWRSLNIWLSENDYEYGRPTAQQINSKKYISYAQSQAVVRDGDRQKFHHLFKKYGFSGDENFSNEEIEVYLSSWIHSSASNARLSRAWSKTELRSIFCGVVLAELESWSENAFGKSVASSSPYANQSLSLALSVSPSFPKPILTLLLGRSTIVPEPITDLALEGTDRKLIMSNDTYGGFASLSPNVVRRSNTVLLDEIKISNEAKSVQFSWKPRLIIPFKRTLDGAFSVEVSRVNVATNHDVLVRDSTAIRSRVDEYLATYSDQQSRVARDGEIKGVPDGWLLYRHVFILPHDDDVHDNLQVLKPLRSDTSVMFDGGMNLGNNIWHSQKPPTIKIMSKSTDVTLSIYKLDQDSDSPLISRDDLKLTHILTQDLECLGNGEYRIQSQIGTNQASNLGVNFRSADRPRPLHSNKMCFPYCDVSGVAAEALDPKTMRVEGLNVFNLKLGPNPIHEAISNDQNLPDFDDEDWQPNFLYQIDNLTGSQSCVGRGYHRWLCDTLQPGLPRSTPLNMQCQECKESVLTRDRGLVAPKKIASINKPTQKWVNDDAPSCAIDFDVFYDGLCYLGMGNRARLERLLSSFEDHPKYISAIVHNLSALGHLDLRLSKGSGRLEHWSIPQATLHFVNSKKAILSGFRSPEFLRNISAGLEESVGTLDRKPLVGQPAIITIEGLNADELSEQLSDVKDPLGRQIHIIEDPISSFGQALISLPGLENSLKAFSLGRPDDLKKFDVLSGKWREAETSHATGAYRFAYMGPTYIYKDDDGLCLSGPYQWIKTLAAKSAGRRLHSYNKYTKEFRAAMGVEPLGIMSRALVLSTGQLPHVADKKIIFTNVDAGIAAAVLYNLYHREISL